MHTILLTLRAILLFGDFLTTTMALSIAEANHDQTEVYVSEANPIMASVVDTPVLFLFVKILILITVVAAAYIIRNEGAIAYLPCIFVYSFCILINLNNVVILAGQ